MNKDIFSLSGMVVVITGAGGLLGRQHAFAVASAGGTPVLLDLDNKNTSKLSDEINKKYGVDAVCYVVDITKENEVAENCQLIVQRFGRINGLINNASNNPRIENKTENFSRLERFKLSQWEADLGVGLTGAFLCIKYFGLAISKQGGSIVNISSDLGLIAPDQRLYRKDGLAEYEQPVKPVSYSVVKSGLIGLTRYISTYWPTFGVRCNVICPGGVENNQEPEFIKKISERIPLGRMADPSEYQGAIIFLLSPASSYMNGAVIVIDGGRTAW